MKSCWGIDRKAIEGARSCRARHWLMKARWAAMNCRQGCHIYAILLHFFGPLRVNFFPDKYEQCSSLGACICFRHNKPNYLIYIEFKAMRNFFLGHLKLVHGKIEILHCKQFFRFFNQYGKIWIASSKYLCTSDKCFKSTVSHRCLSTLFVWTNCFTEQSKQRARFLNFKACQWSNMRLKL